MGNKKTYTLPFFTVGIFNKQKQFLIYILITSTQPRVARLQLYNEMRFKILVYSLKENEMYN